MARYNLEHGENRCARIRDHFGVDLQERLIGKYRKRWGFAPQRPAKRALERNPEAVRQRLEQDYPRLRAQAAQVRGGDLLGR